MTLTPLRKFVPIALFLLGAPLAAEEVVPVPRSFTLGAQIRLRAEGIKNRDLRSDRDDSDAFALSRVRISLGFRIGDNLSALAEFQDSRTFGSEASTTSNEKNLDLRQGFLRIGNEASFLKLGRQPLTFGEQRLVGDFDWDNVGRVFDAAYGRYTFLPQRLAVEGFFAKVKESPAAPERDDTDFAGVVFKLTQKDTFLAEPYVFWLHAGERDALGNDRTTTTFGARLHGKAFSHLVWDAEGAFQTGSDLNLDRRAWAFAGYLRWEMGGVLNPSLAFEWSRATGDGNSNDGRSEEFDNLFPTNHLKYGFLDLLGLRNNQMLGLAAGIAGERPLPGAKPAPWSLRLIGRLLALEDERGAWKAASGVVLGRDASGASGKRVGTELDLVGVYPVMPGLAAHLQAGWFVPGAFAKAVRGPDDALGGAFYLVFTY